MRRSISCRRELGIMSLSPRDSRPSAAVISSRSPQYCLISSGDVYLWCGQPSLATLASICSDELFSVAFLISFLVVLTGRSVISEWTITSISSAASWSARVGFSLQHARDSVSGSCRSLPGTYVTLSVYRCSFSIIRWSRGGALAIGFFIIAYSGWWSVATSTCFP